MSDQQIAKLESPYDCAMIGITVPPVGRPRFVYSLTKLAQREKVRQHLVSLDTAREYVARMVRGIHDAHGDRAPVFVDDTSYADAGEDEPSRVIAFPRADAVPPINGSSRP